MSRNLKIIEGNAGKLAYLGPYHEIAVHVRNLLKCDYAMVAVPDSDSIRIKTAETEKPSVNEQFKKEENHLAN